MAITPARLPWLIDINVFMTPISHTNWNDIGTDSNFLKTGRMASSNAQNDEINWDVVLAKGTWSVEVMYAKGSNNGIMSIQIDSVEKGTIDAYDSSNSYNNRTTVSGISITRTQKYRLKLKVTDKNASALGYTGTINHVQLRRTA